MRSLTGMHEKNRLLSFVLSLFPRVFSETISWISNELVLGSCTKILIAECYEHNIVSKWQLWTFRNNFLSSSEISSETMTENEQP